MLDRWGLITEAQPQNPSAEPNRWVHRRDRPMGASVGGPGAWVLRLGLLSGLAAAAAADQFDRSATPRSRAAIAFMIPCIAVIKSSS